MANLFKFVGTDEKNCSWMEVECLGACVNAPMMLDLEL